MQRLYSLLKKNREIISGFQTAESLKPYLARQFEKDINDKNVDPRTIFKEYGTHVLSDIIIGGRVSINWEYTNTDNKTSKEIETNVSTTISAVSANTDVTSGSSAKDFNEKSKINASAIGGSGFGSLGDITAVKDAYKTWAGTVKDNPVFIDSPEIIREEDIQTGIWLFANDEERQKQIQESYVELRAEVGDYFSGLQTAIYVKEIRFFTTNENLTSVDEIRSAIAKIEHTKNFILVGENSSTREPELFELNHCAGDPYVYMYYFTTRDYSEAIKGLAVSIVFPKEKTYPIDPTDPFYPTYPLLKEWVRDETLESHKKQLKENEYWKSKIDPEKFTRIGPELVDGEDIYTEYCKSFSDFKDGYGNFNPGTSANGNGSTNEGVPSMYLWVSYTQDNEGNIANVSTTEKDLPAIRELGVWNDTIGRRSSTTPEGSSIWYDVHDEGHIDVNYRQPGSDTLYIEYRKSSAE